MEGGEHGVSEWRVVRVVKVGCVAFACVCVCMLTLDSRLSGR